jgi:hypothetical protein
MKWNRKWLTIYLILPFMWFFFTISDLEFDLSQIVYWVNFIEYCLIVLFVVIYVFDLRNSCLLCSFLFILFSFESNLGFY